MQGAEQLLREAHARPGIVTERLRWLTTEMIEGAKESADDLLIVQQAVMSEAVPPDVREMVLHGSRIPLELLRDLLHEGQFSGEIIAGDPDQRPCCGSPVSRASSRTRRSPSISAASSQGRCFPSRPHKHIGGSRRVDLDGPPVGALPLHGVAYDAFMTPHS
jgi:hypothetical protein